MSDEGDEILGCLDCLMMVAMFFAGFGLGIGLVGLAVKFCVWCWRS